MNFSFHPEAEIELNKAIDYYENIYSDLGLDFANEVYVAIQRSMSLPEAWAIIDGNIRRSLVNRFPFGVLYSKEDDKILVIAVMHLNRLPNYWKDRM
ncbi:MAG: type II toxin-antitoxin system RelE/ParE family toxin [Candidatus Thioglobus sp.]|nr:type II toxin-antitoxin system RelE/ParE family toxin [Candidatus Thioglobus pontius]MBL6976939.1 type II toxin-antitoxin system RelE/ParE family toxin [Candidatus Thioglobus sp.]MBL6984659.1 type II toxin-antitoxin system RelE/ParE family toxin [Candidatus Thioglobus sp.]